MKTLLLIISLFLFSCKDESKLISAVETDNKPENTAGFF